MEKLSSVYADLAKLNDRELEILANYLATRFDRRDIFLKVIFDELIHVVFKNHHQLFALLLHPSRTFFARIVCPYMSYKELRLLSLINDFKAVINLRELLRANISDTTKNLRKLRHWLIQNIHCLKQNSKVHEKVYISNNGSYITSCNLSKKGKSFNLEAGIHSETKWFVDETTPIYDEAFEGGESLTVEMIDNAFTKINQLNASKNKHDVDAILTDMDASEYEGECHVIGCDVGAAASMIGSGPNFKDKRPKSIFTYYFITLLDKLRKQNSFSHIIETYFDILKWQRGDVDIPADLVPDYRRMADAITEQRLLMAENNSALSSGNSKLDTLLIDYSDDVDSQIEHWKNEPLEFIELFNKELCFRANRFVKVARAIDLKEKICASESIRLIQLIRKDIEVIFPRTLQPGDFADKIFIPPAQDIIKYQIGFFREFDKEVSVKGSPLFHNTVKKHNDFLMNFYFPESHKKPVNYLVKSNRGQIEFRRLLSKNEAECICRFFSKAAISHEPLLESGRDLFENHLKSCFSAIEDAEPEIIADLFAAFMGVDSFGMMEYLSSTSVG